jgi:phosphatidate phosphatase PAH1
MRNAMLVFLPLALSVCSRIPPVDVPIATGKLSQVVVFDIDGTLTPRNIDINEARPGAAESVKAYEKKGYRIVYLTMRTPVFQSNLKNWLRQNGFPLGVLHVAQTASERDNPASYKAGILEQYVKAGWTIAYAYGDSTTDFTAYAQAGIPKDHVFALKRKGEAGCQPGAYRRCLDGWRQHLPFIEREVERAS